MNDGWRDDQETEHLLREAGQGDQNALAVLLDRHRDALRQMVALRLDDRVRQRVDESDIVQETFLEAQRRLPEFLSRRPMPFALWLKRTARQHVLLHYRRHARTERRSVFREQRMVDASSQQLARCLVASSPSPSALVAQQEYQACVREALARLPRRDYEILLMRHVEGLLHREIGQILKLSEANVRQRYGRALIRLKDELERSGLGDGADEHE